MTDERRVVEFGDVRYEYLDGHWWCDGLDVTPQERALVEELERQQTAMRELNADRARLRVQVTFLSESAERERQRLAAAVRMMLTHWAMDRQRLAAAVRMMLTHWAMDSLDDPEDIFPEHDELLGTLPSQHGDLLRALLEGGDR